MDVRLPDGTVVTNVPDGMTQTELAARLTKANAQGGPTDDQLGRRAVLGAIPFAGGMYAPDMAMGARQVLDSAAEGLAHVFGQRKSAADVNQQALDEYKQTFGQLPGSGAARGAGQAVVAATALPASSASGVLMGAAQGAGQGALANMATPAYGVSDENYAASKMQQAKEGALLGAGLGGGLTLAGKVLAPKVAPEVRAMLDEGITPTPGQMLGGAFKSNEEKLTSMPLLGDAIKSAQTKALNEYNVALYNRILKPLGEKYDGPAGQQGIAAVGDKLSNAYDDALARSVPSELTDAFRAKMNALAQMVPESKRADFISAVNGQVKPTLGNTITPSVAKAADSELGRLARQYKSSAIGDEREYANAIQQAQSNLRQLVAEFNPQVAPQLRAIDRGWSDLVQLENAANGTKQARAGGLVTPADQLRGIKKSDYSVRDRRFARGEMPNQDFAQAADAVLSSKYPDSGSMGRYIANTGALGLLGGTPVMDGGATILGSAIASLPYLPGGRQAIAALLARRPQGAEDLGNLVQQLAPYLGAASGGLLSR